jgi:hypothetical protein
MEKPKYKPEHALMEAIGFSEDDLEANRRGVLSEAQRDRLRRDRTRLLALTGVALVSFAVSGWLCAGSFFYGANTSLFQVASFPFVIAIIILGVSRTQLGPWRNDWVTGKVAALEGRVRLDIGPGNPYSYYKIVVEGQTFGVRKDVFLAFKNGDLYRIYYGPNSKWLLSAEWLRDESPQEISDGEAEVQTRIRPDGGDALD